MRSSSGPSLGSRPARFYTDAQRLLTTQRRGKTSAQQRRLPKSSSGTQYLYVSTVAAPGFTTLNASSPARTSPRTHKAALPHLPLGVKLLSLARGSRARAFLFGSCSGPAPPGRGGPRSLATLGRGAYGTGGRLMSEELCAELYKHDDLPRCEIHLLFRLRRGPGSGAPRNEQPHGPSWQSLARHGAVLLLRAASR